jgi:shikimate kinase
MPKAKSKRQTSSQRHKVERKIREHKRDIRKAAKTMKAGGLKPRNKKSLETAKLALRVSNSNPDKERILKGLIASREAAKEERTARRQAIRDGGKAEHLRERGAEDVASDDEDEAASEGSDDGEAEEGVSDKLFKRSRAELAHAEERLTSKQVQERERQRAKAQQTAANAARQREAMSQHLLIPAGEHVGSPHLQFGKVVDSLALEVPVFIVTLDARCAVQSIPWEQLDSIVAAATLTRDALHEAEEAAASPQGKTARPSGRVSGKANGAADASAVDTAERINPTSSSVQRMVLLVLNKAELVPLDVLALGYSNVAEAIHGRYGDLLKPAPAPANSNPVPGTITDLVATTPVTFTCLPHSAVVDGSSNVLLRTLRNFHAAFVAPFDAYRATKSNMKGKIGVCVIGFPGTGKTTLCRCLQQMGTDSVVSTVPCRTIRTATSKDEGASTTSKIIIPSAKQITLVTIADDEQLKATPIASGDAVFHSISRLEKLKEPETVAVLLAEQFRDQTALCQALSLPIMPTAVAFLKAFGRCIIRERGFQPSGVFAGGGGSLSNSHLSVSDAQGAAMYVAGLRKVHVKRRHDDGRNPLRVGARTFLKTFHEGRHIVWAVKRNAAEAETTKDHDVAAMVNVFSTLYVPKQVLTALSADDAAALRIVKQTPGAVLLMVVQFAMRDAMALLPHKALEVDASAVIAPSHEDEDDEEDDEEFEEEEGDDGEEDDEDEGEDTDE